MKQDRHVFGKYLRKTGNLFLSIRKANEILTIVVLQFIPAHWWENLLPHQTALTLRFALLFKPGVVVVEVPYLV